MKVSGIKNIIINLENNKTIVAPSELFTNLYVSNIDSNGDEIPYDQIDSDSSLIGNFFMIKLKNKIIEYNLTNKNLKENAFNIIKDGITIDSIIINFENGKSLPFIIKSNDTFEVFKEKEDLCIVQSEYNIKYLENLFA